MWLFLRFATLNMRHSFPSRIAITALWLKSSVSARFLGLAIFAMMAPIIKASMMHPIIDWKTTMKTAAGHSSVTKRAPYPMVVWVSTENRKAATKVWTFMTQGTKLSSLPWLSMSPWSRPMTQNAKPNINQDTTNTKLNSRNMYRQRMSTQVVKMSDMYRCDFSSMFVKWMLHWPVLPTNRLCCLRRVWIFPLPKLPTAGIVLSLKPSSSQDKKLWWWWWALPTLMPQWCTATGLHAISLAHTKLTRLRGSAQHCEGHCKGNRQNINTQHQIIGKQRELYFPSFKQRTEIIIQLQKVTWLSALCIRFISQAQWKWCSFLLQFPLPEVPLAWLH